MSLDPAMYQTPAAEARMVTFFAALREHGSMKAATDALGVDPANYRKTIQGSLSLQEEFALINDTNYSRRLADTGLECLAGCGPVPGGVKCAGCGKTAQKSRAGKKRKK